MFYGGSTMPTIESVSIEGFWGNHNLFIEFDPSVNFLVGVNGSGKTTAIDVLASALQCDGETLERLPFKKIVIVLFDKETRRKPSIIVERDRSNEGRDTLIEYKFKEFAGSPADQTKLFQLFAPREHSLYSGRVPRSGEIFRRKAVSGYDYRDVRMELSKLIKMSWLSINRESSMRSGPENDSKETQVDRKIREISNRLERYFSILSINAIQQTRNFQKELFRSLIAEDSFSLRTIREGMDLEKEKSALIDIFNRFNFPRNEYENHTEHFFESLGHLLQGKNQKSSYNFDEAKTIINAHKIHALVGEWNDVVAAEKEILQPREAFTSILDSMFRRKSAIIKPTEEIVFETTSGKALGITELSSGEKQLFIILGEALLQKDAEWTYIADEPELSLHVAWQEVLVDNLRALNSNSQVIFATHSPDIISRYSKHVIDMEEVLK